MSDYEPDGNRHVSAAVAAAQLEDDHDLYVTLDTRSGRNAVSPHMTAQELVQEPQPASLNEEDDAQEGEIARFAAQHPPGPFTVTFPSAAAYAAAVSPMKPGKTRTASEAATPSRHAADATTVQERHGKLARNGALEARRDRIAADASSHVSALCKPFPPVHPRAASDAAKFHRAAAFLQQSTQMLEEIVNDDDDEQYEAHGAAVYRPEPLSPHRAPDAQGSPVSPTASNPAGSNAGGPRYAYEAPTPPGGGADVFYIKQEPLTEELQRLLYERPDREPSPSIQQAQRRSGNAPRRSFFNMPVAPAMLQSTAPEMPTQPETLRGSQPVPSMTWHEWPLEERTATGSEGVEDDMVIDVDDWAASQAAYTEERRPANHRAPRAQTAVPPSATQAPARRASTLAPSRAPHAPIVTAVSHEATMAPTTTSAPAAAPFPPPARPFAFGGTTLQPAPTRTAKMQTSGAFATHPPRVMPAFPVTTHAAALPPQAAFQPHPGPPAAGPAPPPPVDLSLHPVIARGNGKFKANANDDLIDGMPLDGHLANLRATQRRAWVKHHGPKMVFWCDNFDGTDPSQMDPSAATTKLENALAALFGDGSQPEVTWAESEPGSKTPVRKNTFLLKNITFEQMLFLLLRRRLLIGPAAITTFQWDLPASPYIGTFVGTRLNNPEIEKLVIDVWSTNPAFTSIFDRSMPQGRPSDSRRRDFFKSIKVETDQVTANDVPVTEHRVYGQAAFLTPALRAEMRAVAASIVLEHDFKGSASIRSPEWFCQTCDRISHGRNACTLNEEIPGYTRASTNRAHQQPFAQPRGMGAGPRNGPPTAGGQRGGRNGAAGRPA
ncbi:hypothetical protein AURDEDRAFT_128639 [Auricularia subglabra TFB-10046 SS5]|nr:hypothetical protein AURDEDRAFT_128639 [Auricularia subglabra TFB-10046 SS5]